MSLQKMSLALLLLELMNSLSLMASVSPLQVPRTSAWGSRSRTGPDRQDSGGPEAEMDVATTRFAAVTDAGGVDRCWRTVRRVEEWFLVAWRAGLTCKPARTIRDRPSEARRIAPRVPWRPPCEPLPSELRRIPEGSPRATARPGTAERARSPVQDVDGPPESSLGYEALWLCSRESPRALSGVDFAIVQ